MDGLLSPYLRKWRFSVIKDYIGGNVLDYGCGVGLLPQYVYGISRYVGVDLNSADLEFARKNNPNHTFMRPEELQPSDAYDTIVSLAVIEYIEDLEVFFKNISAMLTEDGVIVITSPHPLSQLVRFILVKMKILGGIGDENRLWLPKQFELTQIASKAGLETVKYKRFMLGLNQMWVFNKRKLA